MDNHKHSKTPRGWLRPWRIALLTSAGFVGSVFALSEALESDSDGDGYNNTSRKEILTILPMSRLFILFLFGAIFFSNLYAGFMPAGDGGKKILNGAPSKESVELFEQDRGNPCSVKYRSMLVKNAPPDKNLPTVENLARSLLGKRISFDDFCCWEHYRHRFARTDILQKFWLMATINTHTSQTDYKNCSVATYRLAEIYATLSHEVFSELIEEQKFPRHLIGHPEEIQLREEFKTFIKIRADALNLATHHIKAPSRYCQFASMIRFIASQDRQEAIRLCALSKLHRVIKFEQKDFLISKEEVFAYEEQVESNCSFSVFKKANVIQIDTESQQLDNLMPLGEIYTTASVGIVLLIVLGGGLFLWRRRKRSRA